MTSSLLNISNDSVKGRCYTLKSSVKQGTLLLKTQAYGLVPDSESKRRVCASCFSWLDDNQSNEPFPIGCFSTHLSKRDTPQSNNSMDLRVHESCDHVFYCSLECSENDWKNFHSIECKFFREFFMQIPVPLNNSTVIKNKDEFDHYTLDFMWLMMRMLIRRAKEIVEFQLDPCITFDDVWDSCSNEECFPLDKMNLMQQVAHRLCDFVSHHLFKEFPLITPELMFPQLKNENILFKGILALICKEECNSFGLYTFRYLGPLSPRQGYALGLYPKAVYFNHACIPNVGHVFKESLENNGKELLFYSLCDIEKGQELTISYLPLENNSQSVESRRQRLKEHFFFVCDCLRCQQELTGNLNPKQQFNLTNQLCQFNGCKGRFIPSLDHLLKKNPNPLPWTCEACGYSKSI